MNILFSGSTGLVGTSLCRTLRAQGHNIAPLTRATPQSGQIFWDPLAGILDASQLSGIDTVIHLAGENIAGRWTEKKQRAIRDSRQLGTRTLCEALARMDHPPKTLISASAIGYYGDRGDELLTETSTPGSGFLAEVCQAWEAATAPAVKSGIRTVLCRIGVVLSPNGGALAKMLLPFKLGAGGVIGSGKQFMSCIALDDVVAAMIFALNTEALIGPINLVMPEAVTNRVFTKTLGKVLSRPTIFPMPAFAARLAFGEMADALLLGSARVKPERLQAANFPFKYPTLETALRGVLKR